MTFGNSFKRLLGFDRGLCIHLGEEVNVGETREMIDEDRCTDVPFLRGSSSVYRDETGSRADELIDAHDLPWCGGWSYWSAVANAFVRPFSVGFGVGTPRTGGWIDVLQVLCDEASLG